MLIHPELQALRGDDAPQRLAQSCFAEILNQWRRGCGGEAVEAELGKFGAGEALEDLPLLSSLFDHDADLAGQFVAGLLEPIIAQLKRQPLSQSPLRYSVDDTQATLVIARRASTTLTLQAIDSMGLARKPTPSSIGLSRTETYERVLAGSADAVHVRVTSQHADGAALQRTATVLRTGEVSHRLGHQETRYLTRISGCLVTLRLQRLTGGAEPMRELRLEDGLQIHQAAGHPRDSRLELTAALLGKMGRSDAAPLLSAMAEEEGSQSLRWQALRECLGLDTELGFRTLCEIARRAGDPLAVPAGALRAQLIEAHPQLAGLCPCPM